MSRKPTVNVHRVHEVVVGVAIPVDIHVRLQRYCSTQNIYMKDFVAEAIQGALDRAKAPKERPHKG